MDFVALLTATVYDFCSRSSPLRRQREQRACDAAGAVRGHHQPHLQVNHRGGSWTAHPELSPMRTPLTFIFCPNRTTPFCARIMTLLLR